MIIRSKIIKRIPGYRFGYFPCEVSGAMQVYQTGEEGNAIEILNFRLDVSKVITHPDIEIPYFYDGKNHLYHPDVYFENNCGNLLEIKASAYRHTVKNLAKFKAAILLCNTWGWHFHVWDEFEISNGNLLENIRFLRRYSKYKLSQAEIWQLEEIIRVEKRALTIEELANKRSSDPRTIIPYIYCMIFRHLLYADLENETLSLNTLVYLPMMEGRPDYA